MRRHGVGNSIVCICIYVLVDSEWTEGSCVRWCADQQAICADGCALREERRVAAFELGTVSMVKCLKY